MTEGKLSNAFVCDELRKAIATTNPSVVVQTARDLASYGETWNSVNESLAAVCDEPLNADSRAAVSSLLSRYTFDSHVKRTRLERLEAINDEPAATNGTNEEN